MIPFKKKPYSIVKNTAVLLILLCISDASFGFIGDSRRTVEDSRVSLGEFDRRVSAKDESDRISVNLERKSTVASPYIRDVRADSRQSRIDARDIRTDFREIRTELREAQINRVGERNVRDIRTTRGRNSHPDDARRQDSSIIRQLGVFRDNNNNNIRSKQSTRNVQDISYDRQSGKNIENSRKSQLGSDERRNEVRNMRRQTVRESLDRTLTSRTNTRREERRDVRAESRNSRDVLKSFIVRREEPRVSQRQRDTRREDQPRLLEERESNVRRSGSSRFGREEGRYYNNDDTSRINKERRETSRDLTERFRDLRTRVLQRDSLQQDRSRQLRQLDISKERQSNLGRLENFRIARRDQESNNRNREDVSRSDRGRLLERSRNLKSRVLQQDSLQAEQRYQPQHLEALRMRQNNVQRSENAGELRFRAIRRDSQRLEGIALSRTQQRRMNNDGEFRTEASRREREPITLRQKREVSEDRFRTNQDQNRRVQEHREDSERISRDRQIKALRTSQQADEQRRISDKSRERMTREQREKENVRESRQTGRNEDVERRGRTMSIVRDIIRGSRKVETRTDADPQRELRNSQLRDTRVVDSRRVEFIPNFKEKSNMLMNTLQVIIGAVLLGQIFLNTPKNKIGFASVQNLFRKEKIC